MHTRVQNTIMITGMQKGNVRLVKVLMATKIIRNHLYNILVKSLVEFCPYLEGLWKVYLKCNGLGYLLGEN